MRELKIIKTDFECNVHNRFLIGYICFLVCITNIEIQKVNIHHLGVIFMVAISSLLYTSTL